MPPVPKIMVIDDESAVRRVVCRFLSGAGLATIECADGLEAVKRWMAEKPDLIVLDVEMPRLDGWKTLQELRRQGYRCPVVMLTNLNEVPDRVRGLEAGADDYLGKPCDLIELLARVRAQLRRAQTPLHASRRLQFGPLLVDLTAKTARRGETAVRFTRTEFALLALLAEHRGQPVSRDLILQTVWPASAGANSHTLDTCLWRLRGKLADGSGHDHWIRNLSGIGYVLDCDADGAT